MEDYRDLLGKPSICHAERSRSIWLRTIIDFHSRADLSTSVEMTGKKIAAVVRYPIGVTDSFAMTMPVSLWRSKDGFAGLRTGNWKLHLQAGLTDNIFMHNPLCAKYINGESVRVHPVR